MERKLLGVLALPVGGMLLSMFAGGVTEQSVQIAVLVFGLFWVVPAAVAYEIAARKDRGVWWGVCLGWFGVAIAAMISPDRRGRVAR